MINRTRISLDELSPKGALEKFKAFYSYDSVTGNIIRNSDGYTYNYISKKGYKQPLSLKFDGIEYHILYHRLCWFLYYGEFVPKNLQIDHINNDKLDNSIENLQILDNSNNSYKRDVYKSNTSGFKGVSYTIDKIDGLEYPNYLATIAKDGKIIKIGRFKENKTLAAKFYDAANRFLFDELSKTNFKDIYIPVVDIKTLRSILKDLKKTMPSLEETPEFCKKLGELLESYGYLNTWK